MTKQQLREAIRKVIQQELDEAKTYPVAGEKGYVKVSDLKKGDILGGSGLEVVSKSAGAKTPSGKVEVTVKDPKTGKELTKTWSKSTTVRVKDKMNEAPYPAVAPDETEEDVETTPYITPDEDDDDLTIGNPNVKPNPQAIKNIMRKIIDRYTTSLNEKKFK